MVSGLSTHEHSERSVRPADCGLLISVPVDTVSFRERLERRRGYVADMAREYGWTPRSADAAWTLYERVGADPVRRATDRCVELGVAVIADAHLRDLRPCCERHPVVTLFAHCDSSDPDHALVEFAEGLVPLVRVVEEIPDAFAGVIELALCRSWRLGEVVKTMRPDSLVIVHRDEIRPAFRAPFYRAVIEELAQRPRRYTDVVIDLAKELLR